jgi:mRNA interferase RelE/StbE
LAWTIEIAESAAKTLKRLDKSIQQRIARSLYRRVATLEDPRSVGEPLRGPVLGRYWKYRVGDYRIICDIQDQAIKVVVVRIGHRREGSVAK